MDKYNWWDKSENKESFPLPISVVKCEGGGYVACCNSETNNWLGDDLFAVAQGDTKEEAISTMFKLIRANHSFSEKCRMNYQRWVPFRKGNWSRIGGSWFVVFGLHFYFRHGNNMKGGWYIPFTKMNISFYSEWVQYKNWKKNNNE